MEALETALRWLATTPPYHLALGFVAAYPIVTGVMWTLTSLIFYSRNERQPLPPLPEARSSHDVVMIGTRLFVVGGWRLVGSTRTAKWPEHGLTLDLASARPAWEPFPQPFRRRA